jgi:hypothetical protein
MTTNRMIKPMTGAMRRALGALDKLSLKDLQSCDDDALRQLKALAEHWGSFAGKALSDPRAAIGGV